MAEELDSKVSINLLDSVLFKALHFLGIPEKLSTQVLFLQSASEIATAEVLLSRRASGYVRHPKLAMSRKSFVLETLLLALFVSTIAHIAAKFPMNRGTF